MKKMTILLMTCLCLFADEFVEESTTIGGYGEMHYDMKGNDGDGKLDFHRFILYIKHNFSDQWSMMSEIEIEHNMVGSYYEDCTIDDTADGGSEEECDSGGSLSKQGKGGYVAMEQAYLNYWNGKWGFRGGVVLVPSGIINEFHEPPTFMSVERPEYSSYIIPTTWFENGFSFYGKMNDINWNLTMTGDLDGNEIGSGLKNARDKGHYSSTSSWTKTLQLSYSGMDGLKIGGSITTNDAPVDDDEVGNPQNPVGVNLTELNATWTKNNIYARLENGSVSYENNGDLESSSGYYLDLGYNIANMVGCDGDLYLWTRTSQYSLDDDNAHTTNKISLFGLTFKPENNISFKLEAGNKNAWSNDENKLIDYDVMRFGLGYMF